MRNGTVLLGIGVVLALALVMGAPRGTTQAQVGGEETPTPTNTAELIYFTIIHLDPTHTPTNTPTPTITPTATATQFNCGTGFNGHLELRDPKPSYATHIENVFFNEYVHNPTGSTICFGILGISSTGPQQLPFKTSWDGAGATGQVLQIWAGCYGPANQPCANSSAAGRSEDHLGDWNGTGPFDITEPGNYQATLYVCYSPFSSCLAPGGHWAPVSGAVQFVMVHWTPSAVIADATPTPLPPTDERVCYLITDDPEGIYLSCTGKETKSTPRSR